MSVDYRICYNSYLRNANVPIAKDRSIINIELIKILMARLHVTTDSETTVTMPYIEWRINQPTINDEVSDMLAKLPNKDAKDSMVNT